MHSDDAMKYTSKQGKFRHNHRSAYKKPSHVPRFNFDINGN